MSDPWDEIMKDAVKGIPGEYIIERDDGREEILSVIDYDASLLEWNEPERLGIQHVRGKVLDIGCGAGRVALFLQNQGHEIVGIDSSPGAIEACKMKGLREAYIMSVDNLDFPDAVFDTVIMYGNNFGLSGDDKNIVGMLESLHIITTSEGIIIAGSADVEKTNDQSHLDYHQRNLEMNRPKGLIRLRVKYKDLVGDWSDLRLASPQEMRSLAEKAGWKLSRVYDGEGSFVGILTKS
ncbi:class I SAM-dependent methyltransferase [Candidatus Thorarchaeota archaeon]|nr:MAG: class I SAM-dependent methyltransferase [Candidatus Thorarchaeota archaeon]